MLASSYDKGKTQEGKREKEKPTTGSAARRLPGVPAELRFSPPITGFQSAIGWAIGTGWIRREHEVWGEFGNLEFGIVLAPRCFVRGIEASHWVLVCTPKIPEALAAARCAGGPEEGSGYRCARFWMGMASRARRGKKIETRPHSSARTDAIVAEPGVGQFQNPTVDERAGRRLR